MQTIGEKLEEARKRRGTSIREAAEATKIRSDYLTSFESNSFDLPVPAIYVRGFLRVYAQFLKLNPEKIITDYNAHVLGESRFARRDSREFLGRMDLDQGGEATAEENLAPAEAGPVELPVKAPARDAGFDYASLDKGFLRKYGFAFAAAGVVFVVAVVIIVAVLRSDPVDPANIASAENSAAAAVPAREFVISAEGGDILQVIVTEVATGREIFRGPLPAGQTRRISYDDQVRLSYTNAEFLFIENEGVRYKIGGRGPRQSTFPQRPRQSQL